MTTDPKSTGSTGSEKKKRTLAHKIRNFLFALGLVLVLAAGALVTQYFLSLQDPRDYLPFDNRAWVQVPSLRTVWEDLINLEVADLALSETGLGAVRPALAEIRARDLGRNFFLRQILDVPAELCIDQKGRVLGVISLGWRSIFTRYLGLASGFIQVPGLSVIQKEGRNYFQMDTGEESRILVHFKDNLALVAMDIKVLEEALKEPGGPTSLSSGLSPQTASSLSRGGGTIRTVVDAQGLFRDLTPVGEPANPLLAGLKFSSQAILRMKPDNRRITLEVTAQLNSEIPALQDFLSNLPGAQRIWAKLPQTVSFASAVRIPSLENLLEMAAVLKPDLGQNLKTADDALSLAFGKNLQDLLLSWAGQEMGLITLGSDPDPVFFLEVKDRPKLEAAIEALRKSLVTDAERVVEFRGRSFYKITIPDFFASLLSLGGFKSPSPYCYWDDDFFFLAMQPEALLQLADNQSPRLLESPEFQALIPGGRIESTASVFYSLDKATPFFLESNSLLTRILKLYGRGLAMAGPWENSWKLDFRGIKSRSGLVRPLAGFPREAGGRLSSPVLLTQFPDSALSKMIYLRGGNELVLMDPLSGQLVTTPTLPEAALVPAGALGGTFLYRVDGLTDFIGPEGKSILPFPKTLSSTQSFPPLVFGPQLLVSSREKGTLAGVSPSGEEMELGLKFSNPVLSPPAARFGLLAFSQRSFDGSLVLSDSLGRPQSGWPQPVLGLTAGSPAFVKSENQALVAVITEAGELSVWGLKGETKYVKPQELEGPFRTGPGVLRLSGSRELLVLLNQKGKLTLVDPLTGRTQGEKTLEDLGPEAKITAADGNKDGKDEIYIYGSSQYIIGLDERLNPLEEFPLKGFSQPQWADLDGDGFIEMISSTLDDRIHAYTLRF